MTSPVPTRQAPGVYRRRVGDTVVTAINDGGLPLSVAFLSNIEAEAAEALLRAAGRPPSHLTPVNAFTVQSAGQTVLIDSGAGPLMGPGAGRLLEGLAASGIAPAEIDVVLLTHMHMDHLGGLVDASGQAVFPNARLMASEVEAAFWFDEARAAAAPEAARPTFAQARRLIPAYAGRMQTFSGGDPTPGITAVPLPGHTPGHTGFAIGHGADQLLIWGDIFHLPDVQSRHPEAAMQFDSDQPTAIATRRAILARATDEGLVVAGMHMNFPGFAKIARAGDGYAVLPVAWQPEL